MFNTANLNCDLDGYSGHWYVLHTKPRQEKALSADLERFQIPHFLPLARTRRTYGGRIRRIDVPLFPGYMFLCGTEEERGTALKTNRVVHVLDAPDQPRLVADLRQIHRVVTSDEPVDLYPRLKRGSRCRVTGGTLAGLEGVVLRRKGPWRVYVGVEFLGQSAQLEIDPALLEIID